MAACDSEFVGQIFQRCKARHVICVKQARNVLDHVAIAFTKIFYANVLNQMNICEAFSKAKAAVAFQFERHETDLFTILLAEDEGSQSSSFMSKSHECYYLEPNEPGKLSCLSDHIYVKHVNKKLDPLKYRTKAIWKLVNSILKGNRLNELLGLHGIGKTSLV